MDGRGKGVEGENGNGKMSVFSYDAFRRSSRNVRFLPGLESNTFLKVVAEASPKNIRGSAFIFEKYFKIGRAHV